jgi:hypothetical protein
MVLRMKNKASKTLEKREKLKNKLVCNPDFKLLVALGAPRGGFLA